MPADSKLSAEVPADSKLSAEVPADSKLSAEVPADSKLSAEVPADSKLSAEVPADSKPSALRSAASRPFRRVPWVRRSGRASDDASHRASPTPTGIPSPAIIWYLDLMNARYRLLILPATILVASGAFAQGILTLELSFSNPGARSLGFGGAFVALADDATAAYANPAGLVQLTRPEISIEGRSWSYSTPFVVGGRASGNPTGIGIDTTPGLRWRESTADFTGLSFLSYVYPRKRWSLALYRHQLARFTSSYTTDGLFAEGSTYLDTDRWIDRPGLHRSRRDQLGLRRLPSHYRLAQPRSRPNLPPGRPRTGDHSLSARRRHS